MHAFFDLIPSAGEGSAHCAALTDYQLIAAQGADALSFLHGQLTQDVAGLPQDGARFAGYCTAKGRLLATLLMWRAAQADSDDAPQLYALVRGDIAEALLKRLSMFILRSKANLTPSALNCAGVQADAGALEALQTAAGGMLPRQTWQRAELPSGTWIAAPSATAVLRWWWIATDAQLAAGGPALAGQLTRMATATWQAADLAAGLPWISQATQDVFIPQTVNLDLIEGVSFNKGCYPGQEIVARSHYRGTLKRRMAYGLIKEPGAGLPAALAGLDIFQANQPDEPCGRVIDAAHQPQLLSLLFEITLAALPDADLRLGASDGPRITVAPLPYSIIAEQG